MTATNSQSAIVILCLLLAGCESQVQQAIETRTCTTEQMSKVQTEALWCNNNTDYLSTYCYGTAIMRNCEERKK